MILFTSGFLFAKILYREAVIQLLFLNKIKQNKQSIEDQHSRMRERNLKNRTDNHTLIKNSQKELESKRKSFESRYSHLFNPRNK